MSAITQMVNKVMGARGGTTTTRRGTAPRAGMRPTGRMGAGGTRSQDEAIGRGVRRVLGRFR